MTQETTPLRCPPTSLRRPPRPTLAKRTVSEYMMIAAKKSYAKGFELPTKTFKKMKPILTLMVIHIMLGIFAYSFIFESWSVIDSLYFSTVTLTTVGYGGLSPSTTASKIFTIFFALPGIALIAQLLGILGGTILEEQRETMRDVKDKAMSRVLIVMGSGDKDYARETVDKVTEEKPVYAEIFARIVMRLPIISVVLALAIILGFLDGWTVLDSIYFATITATTVGYGDIIPASQMNKLYAVFFIPFAVSVVGEILVQIGDVYMERVRKQAEKEFLERECTLTDLSVMDTDNNGEVDMVEFLSFMLVAMQKVDKVVIDNLKERYHTLDVDGDGKLHKNDLLPHLITRKRSVYGSFMENDLPTIDGSFMENDLPTIDEV